MYKLLSRTHYSLLVAVFSASLFLSTLAGGAVVSAMTSHRPVVTHKPVTASTAQLGRPPLTQKVSAERPYFGVTYQPVTPQLVHDRGLQATEGDLLSQVAANSPATKAGLLPGDVIVAVDGQKVDDAYPLTASLIGHAPGDVIKLQVERSGKVSSVALTLGVLPSAGSN